MKTSNPFWPVATFSLYSPTTTPVRPLLPTSTATLQRGHAPSFFRIPQPRNPTPQRPPGTAAGMQLSGFLSLSFLVLLVGVAAAGAGSNGSATVYELLPKYGLPEGLLPDAVASYSLDGDGRFVVELARPSCYVQFGSYLVYYAQRITGTLKIGSIRGLGGIQVRRFFIWMDVDEIKVDLPPSDSIYFQVGWITKRLAVDEFHQVHSCINETAYRDQIKGLFPEPIYDIEELITGDVHVALQW